MRIKIRCQLEYQISHHEREFTHLHRLTDHRFSPEARQTIVPNFGEELLDVLLMEKKF